MPKISECDRCEYYAHDYHLICALHPIGIESDHYADFIPNSELEGKRFVNFLGLPEEDD